MSLDAFRSLIADNLWMGATPAHNGGEVPEDIHTIINLYPWEPYQLHDHQVFTQVMMLDSDELPDVRLLFMLARHVLHARDIGPVLVHCQVGMNRSGLVTALALREAGMTSKEAIALIREKRDPLCLSNRTFEEWLLSLDEGA